MAEIKDSKEKYRSGYSMEELLRRKDGVIPDEDYTEDASPDELGYEEMTLEELEAAYKDAMEGGEYGSEEDDGNDAGAGLPAGEDGEPSVKHLSRGDAEIIERLGRLPIADDIYFRERKKGLDEGFMDRNISVLPGDPCEVNTAESWSERMEVLKDATDMAARKFLSDPAAKKMMIAKAKREGADEKKLREIRRMGMIDVDKLISSLEQVSDIIRDACSAPQDLRYDIEDTNRILVELCKRVLEDYTNYDVDDIEKIIDWMNRNAKYSSYLALYRQIYFDFVIMFVNELLKHRQNIGDVFIRALNFMIKTNSRVLNVIIKEKSEDFAPVAKYVRELKGSNKL